HVEDAGHRDENVILGRLRLGVAAVDPLAAASAPVSKPAAPTPPTTPLALLVAVVTARVVAPLAVDPADAGATITTVVAPGVAVATAAPLVAVATVCPVTALAPVTSIDTLHPVRTAVTAVVNPTVTLAAGAAGIVTLCDAFHGVLTQPGVDPDGVDPVSPD